jgi:hypothetical protein
LLRHAVDVVFSDGKMQVDWKIPLFLSPLWAVETYLEKAFSKLLKAFSRFVSIHEAVVVIEDSY